jgi:hypothetical protein
VQERLQLWQLSLPTSFVRHGFATLSSTVCCCYSLLPAGGKMRFALGGGNMSLPASLVLYNSATLASTM